MTDEFSSTEASDYETRYAEELREPEPTSGVQAQIDRLRGSDAYLKASHPAHDDTVRAVNALYEKLYASDGTKPFEVTPGKLSADAELKAVLKHPAYRDPRHPEHEKAVKAAELLYNRIFPEGEDLNQANADLDDDEIDEVVREVDPQAAAEERTLKELKAEWGDSYESKLEGARDVVRQLDSRTGGVVSDLLEATQLGSDPIVIRAFADLAEGRVGRDPSPADAKRIIDALQASDVYRKSGPLHEAVVEAVQSLYAIAAQA
jgi:hypothetical protein